VGTATPWRGETVELMVGGFLFQEQHVLRHLGKMASYFFSRFGLEGFGVFGSYDDG